MFSTSVWSSIKDSGQDCPISISIRSLFFVRLAMLVFQFMLFMSHTFSHYWKHSSEGLIYAHIEFFLDYVNMWFCDYVRNRWAWMSVYSVKHHHDHFGIQIVWIRRHVYQSIDTEISVPFKRKSGDGHKCWDCSLACSLYEYLTSLSIFSTFQLLRKITFPILADYKIYYFLKLGSCNHVIILQIEEFSIFCSSFKILGATYVWRDFKLNNMVWLVHILSHLMLVLFDSTVRCVYHPPVRLVYIRSHSFIILFL